MIDISNFQFYRTTLEIVETHKFISININNFTHDFQCKICEIKLISVDQYNDYYFLTSNYFNEIFANLTCDQALISRIIL